MYYPCLFTTEPRQYLCERPHPFLRINTEQVAFHTRRIAKRTKQVKNRTHAKLGTHRRNILETLMVPRCEQKTIIGFKQRLFDARNVSIDIETQCCLHICGP